MRRITMMQAQWQADTQAGEALRFERCKGGYFSADPPYALHITGKTAQAALTGKNLFKQFGMVGATNTLREDGTLLAGNEAYAGDAWFFFQPCKAIPAGVFHTFSFTASHVPDGFQWRWGIAGGNTYQANINRNGRISVTFKTSADVAAGGNILFDDVSGQGLPAGLNILLSDFQLEEGESATDYEPPTGGVPAPNPAYPLPIRCVKEGTTVRLRGKNLAPQAVEAGFWNLSDGAPQSADGYCRVAEIPVPAQSWWLTVSSNLPIAQWVLLSDGVAVQSQSVGGSATVYGVDTDTGYPNQTVKITLNGNASDFEWIQVEEGEDATAFEPYVEPCDMTVPCNLYEGDTWYPAAGRVERHNEVIAAYDGEPLNTGYCATTGEAVVGAQVVNPLTTPETETYPPQNLSAPSGTVIVEQTAVEVEATIYMAAIVRVEAR